MPSLVRVYFLSATLAVSLCAQQSGRAPSCYDKALTQLAMNNCAAQELRQATADLQAAYAKLHARASATNPTAARRIEAAQRAWEAFLNAHLDATFASEDICDYGSVYPMCHAQLRRQLILARTAQLAAMLAPAPEGEVCTGDRYPQPR